MGRSPDGSIRLERLTKRFGDLVAVDALDLAVEPGEIFGFLGPNGAGKTTTVKMITGLLAPTSGRALVAGYDMAAEAPLAKREMALIPDEPFVYPKLTGAEFLHFVGDLYGVPWEVQAKRVPELLALFELTSFAGELLEGYSHGMRQKLLYCGALLRDPKILVLDEPMVGLDPKSARLVKDVFKRLSDRGVTVFMCTHILEIAEKICDRVGIFLKGRLLTVGTVDELRAASKGGGDLEDIFLGLTGGAEHASMLSEL